MTRRGTGRSVSRNSTHLTTSPNLAEVYAQIGRDISLPIVLNSPSSPAQSLFPPREYMPSNAAELLSPLTLNEASTYTSPLPKGRHGDALSRSLHVFPKGDSRMANELESSHPLAAWIASPESERAQRWLRIHTDLPEGWADLLKVDALDLVDLPEAIAKGTVQWQTLALRRLKANLPHAPKVALSFAKALEESPIAPWYQQPLWPASIWLTKPIGICLTKLFFPGWIGLTWLSKSLNISLVHQKMSQRTPAWIHVSRLRVFIQNHRCFIFGHEALMRSFKISLGRQNFNDKS